MATQKEYNQKRLKKALNNGESLEKIHMKHKAWKKDLLR